MKKLLVILLSLAALAATASAESVSIVAPSSVVQGETFDITVLLSDIFDGRPADTLIAFGFNFNYDSSALNLISGGADTSTWDLDISDLGATPPLISGVSFTGFTAGTTEPLTLATLKLQALKGGPTTFTLTFDPDNFLGIIYDNLPVGEANARATVDVTPEPAFLWTVGILGAGLCVWRRKQRVTTTP